MLTAALELFSKNGYHQVSMNQIAERAEFAVGTIYKFFSNKEDLYKSLMLEQADKFYHALNEALEQGDDEIDKLRNYVRTKGATFMENAPIIRLYHTEIRGVSFNIRAGLDVEIRNQIDKLYNSLAGIFERGMQTNLFNKIAEPFHLAIALDSICNSFLFLWLEYPQRHIYPENPEVILNILFNGLIDRESPAQ